MESMAEKDDLMACSDFEAAETLAVLARGSAVRGEASGSAEQPIEELRLTSSGYSSQGEAVGVRQFCGNTSTTTTTTVVTGVLETTNQTVSIVPSQLCSTSYHQPNETTKSRQNLTEAEKEARRMRRVFANRESARQTIRRRQAMHVEFTKKAAYLAKENQSLKKDKELAVKEYSSLKNKNKFLKLQISKQKEAKSRVTQEESKLSYNDRDKVTTSVPPFHSCNHSVLVPLLWPSVVHPEVMQSLHFPTQEESCSANSRSRNSMFILPVPCLLPFVGNALPNEDSSRSSSNPHHSSSNPNTVMGTSNLSTPLNKNLKPGRHSQVDGASDLHNVSNIPQVGLSSRKNPEMVIRHHKKPEEMMTATKARRRRKELMRMKDIRFNRPN